jgi:hypothetical protein
MIEAMGLKIIAQCPLQWHYLCTKFNENLPSGSEVISGHRQSGDIFGKLDNKCSYCNQEIHVKEYIFATGLSSLNESTLNPFV